ncbi:MAG: phosphodiester glycosidase family protein [bacterium]
MRISPRTWRLTAYTTGGILVFFIMVSGGGLLYLSKNPAGAATFTDNVLRPLIGDKAVISLEGAVFGLQDRIKRHLGHLPDTTAYAVDVKTVPVPTTEPLAASTPDPNPPPTPITPIIDITHPLAGEGVWRGIAGTPLFTTFIRTDQERPFAVVNLVEIPSKLVGINEVAGTKYPGGAPGPGKVPQAIQDSGRLIAAFNGGFQGKDGHYGMYADGTTYVPFRKGLSIFLIYADGHTELTTYEGTPLPSDVIAARQNGPLLVINGKTAQNTSHGIDLWAGTAAGGYVTWRSGLGVTADGDLVYAVGPSLTPTSLADALRLAGSQNAMQLDINDFWVRFMVYDYTGGGYTWSPLVKGLTDGGKAYLHGYEKDFFYLYTK